MTEEKGRFSTESRFVDYDKMRSDDFRPPEPPPFDIEHLIQPSEWSCLPTSFCMLLGMDPHEMLKILGHDDERGFHVQELLTVAEVHGEFFMPFEAKPDIERLPCRACASRGSLLYPAECTACAGTGEEPPPPMHLAKLKNLMCLYDGVVVGKVKNTQKPHAGAWCMERQRVLDPTGPVWRPEEFEIETFWVHAP